MDQQSQLLGELARGEKIRSRAGIFPAEDDRENLPVLDDFGQTFHEDAFLIRVNRSLTVSQTYFQPLRR
jgi:hypothetical protein